MLPPKPSDPTHAWTTLSYLRPAFEYLQEQRHKTARAFEILELEPNAFTNPDARVANHRIKAFFDWAEQETGNPHIGLHMGRSMQIHHAGIVGLLILSCQQAGEIFDLHTRYQTLVGSALPTHYTQTDTEICMHVNVWQGDPQEQRQLIEFSLSGWFNLIQQTTGRQNDPLRVELPYAPPADTADLQSMFRCPISYEHPALKIFFTAAIAEFPVLSADPQLKSVLEIQARKRMQAQLGQQANADPYIYRIRELLMEQLPFGSPPVDAIASQLDVSVRTLQRQLDTRNTSYTEIIDQLRSDLVHEHISNPDLSLSEIAMMLGFSEQSSFARAFKRWFGESPGTYRRKA